jgi:hypothetical protein
MIRAGLLHEKLEVMLIALNRLICWIKLVWEKFFIIRLIQEEMS